MDRWIARMERALNLLASRLDDPPGLAELAAAAHISPFHFHRIWRAMTGEPLGQTIARLRIAASQERLAAGGATVTAVAMDGGFGTPQSFARAFRRVTGLTPTQFVSRGADPINVAAREGVPVRIEWRAEGQLVALRQDGGAYRELNALFWQLWNWAESEGRLDGLQGIYGIPLDDPLSVPEDRLRFDACLALADPGRPPAPLRRLAFDAGEFAVLRHIGSYDALEDADQRLIDWLLAGDRMPADMPLFHHFLDDPEEVPAAQLRTDILLRLDPEGGR
ncbi:AraC family transcriptional regulator [Sphingomonas naasensis]|nr:AraC family transcriptional regulator [Sphingomonas naasensis]NIJ21211.1 AraC family transcriptional regulator [Sphingomonas naasensis]